MNIRSLVVLLGLLIVSSASAAPPWPDVPLAVSGNAGFLAVRSPDRGGISLNRAADMAKRAVGGGRVLSAEATDQGGRIVYRIKVLTRGGEVRYVYVDAESGDVSE